MSASASVEISVPRIRNDFENDGLYVAHVNLTFTGHSGPTLTAIRFVGPRQLGVVLAHPPESMAVRAESVNHAARLNSRKASIARFESISLRCSPLSMRVLIVPRRTSAVCCGSSISPEASRKSQAIWSEFSTRIGRGSVMKTKPPAGHHVPTRSAAFSTSAAQEPCGADKAGDRGPPCRGR